MKARGWLTGGVVVVPYEQRDCHRHLRSRSSSCISIKTYNRKTHVDAPVEIRDRRVGESAFTHSTRKGDGARRESEKRGTERKRREKEKETPV